MYQKNDVSYYSRKPAFILAWVNDFLQQCLKNKEVFLSDFLQELEPISFDAKFNHEEKEIDVILKFKVDNEDVTELIVTGKLHRWG